MNYRVQTESGRVSLIAEGTTPAKANRFFSDCQEIALALGLRHSTFNVKCIGHSLFISPIGSSDLSEGELREEFSPITKHYNE